MTVFLIVCMKMIEAKRVQIYQISFYSVRSGNKIRSWVYVISEKNFEIKLLITQIYCETLFLDPRNKHGNEIYINSKILNFRVKSIESYTKTIGYPYKWCQILCGLY